MDYKSKVMTAEEAISNYVHDGDYLVLGGFSTNRRPYGLVREIIRQKKQNLYVEGGCTGGDVDLLLGAGCVKVLTVSHLSNSGFSKVCRRFRAVAENAKLPIEDYSLGAQVLAYHGAALGMPYVAVKNMLGSDLVYKWGISEVERKKYPKLPPKKLIVQDDPFCPGNQLCLIPTPKIDVACIHVQKASPEGICRIEGTPFHDEDIAIAAKYAIISCEEIVPNEEMRKDPGANSLPGLCVTAVVHMPYGAHPSQCCGYYDYDPKTMREYDEISRTQEAFDAYIDTYARCSHQKYLDLIGAERLSKLRVDPAYGFVPGIRQR